MSSSQPTTINITPRLTRQFKKRSKGTFISSEITLLMDPTFCPQCLASHSNQDNSFLPDAQKIQDSTLLSVVRTVFPQIHFRENVMPFSVQWQRERSREFEETLLDQNAAQLVIDESTSKKTYSSRDQEHTYKIIVQKYIFMRLEARKLIYMYLAEELDEFAELILTKMRQNHIEILFLCVEALEKEMHKLHKKIFDKAVKEKRRVEELVMPLEEKDIKSYLFRLQLKCREEHSLMLIIHYSRHEKDTGQYLLNVTKSVAMEDYFDPRQELDITNLQSKKTVGGKAENLKDAWYCFLLEIPKVKKNHAQTIIEKYTTLRKLADIYFDRSIDQETKEDLLANLRTTRGRIGTMVSTAVYEYFTRGMCQEDDASEGLQTQQHSAPRERGSSPTTITTTTTTNSATIQRTSLLSSDSDSEIESLAPRKQKRKRDRKASSTTRDTPKKPASKKRKAASKKEDKSSKLSRKERKSTSRAKSRTKAITDAMEESSSDDEIIILS
mmetsp:Transcript_6925/g.25892  ORF Transcript_6925/g.25892 Transcript_6925/m.25892 type:complete len:498 (-) Transcript_6925:294-1787(-)